MIYEMTFVWRDEIWNQPDGTMVSKIRILSGPRSWICDLPELERPVGNVETHVLGLRASHQLARRSTR